MGRDDDKHWREVQEQRWANEPRRRDDSTGAVDMPLLRPNNEGRDEERQRRRLQDWAGEEGPNGPEARKLREIEAREADAARAAGPVELEEGDVPPMKRHGSPFNEDENIREHHAAGGEPRKHPRAREQTTPSPGRGPHAVHTAPNEPPELERGPGGLDYEHGKRVPVGRRDGGT